MLKRKKKYVLLAALVIIGGLWQPAVKALELNKEVQDAHKTWTLRFNQNIELNHEIKNSITVLDSSGKIMPISIRLSDSKTIAIDAPKEGYKEGETYTIKVDDKFHSKDNHYLQNTAKYAFKLNKSKNKISYSDIYTKEIYDTINLGINKILKDGVEDQFQALALSKHGASIPSNYLSYIEKGISSKKGELEQPIEYSRTVIGLMSLGKNPTNFEGYNLIEKIYNNKQMTNETINTYIFSLIALDTGKFDIPSDAVWTRDKLIKTILDKRTVDKGWDYAGDKADPDMTGMALTALAPYKSRPEVKSAVEDAINKLSSMQKENGAFASWGTENSESICQVIIALCANGIDPTSDSRFIKNGKNPLDALLEYRTEEGGFCHIKGTGYNAMATEQAVEALEAYRLFKEEKGSIYSFK